MVIWTAVRTILKESPRVKAKELVAEVKEITGFSRTTIYEVLSSLDLRGKILRERRRYWLPQSIYVEDTREALAHSERLVEGFQAILAESCWTLYHRELDSKERSRLKEKIETVRNEVKEYAIDHLLDGYLETYGKLTRLRGLEEKAKEALLKEGKTKRDAEAIVNLFTFAGRDLKTSKESEKLLKEREEAYEDFASDIEDIRLKVEAGKRLKGTCRICSKESS